MPIIRCICAAKVDPACPRHGVYVAGPLGTSPDATWQVCRGSLEAGEQVFAGLSRAEAEGTAAELNRKAGELAAVRAGLKQAEAIAQSLWSTRRRPSRIVQNPPEGT